MAVVIRTIKVSEKGQVSIPKDVRKSMRIKKGDDLVMMVKDGMMVLEKSEKMALLLDDEFNDIKALTERSLAELWDNPYDEVWDKVAPPKRRK
jgi:AbrB family looped-hinge helix DNA binding protein